MVFTVTMLGLLVASTFLPAFAQLSQWRSLNPYRDGTLPITAGDEAPFLYSVHFLNPNYGWAVGGTCDIYLLPVGGEPNCLVPPGTGFALHFDGTKWRNVLVPGATGTLTAVFGVSPTDVWAVGLGPTIIHWDGIAWTVVAPPIGLGDLFGLYMLPGGADGWAVGDCPAGGATTGCDPATGEVDNIRWSGTFPSGAWSPGPTPRLLGAGALVETLRAVSLNSPTFGWIVASNGAIFKWDGAGWVLQISPVAVDLLSVHALSNMDAWAVGTGSTIIRWNGASWTGPMVAPTVVIDYRSIKMVSPTDGWIAGGLNLVTVEGLLLRWNGVAWSIVRSWVTQDLNGLFMLPGGTAGSAVGDAETIIRWNNVQWISQTSPTAFPLFDVHMVSSTDGWAVGGGGIMPGAAGGSIFRWDGTHWFHYETLPSSESLLGVFMLNTNDGWAVGSSAGAAAPPIILRWNGVSWVVKSPPGVALGATLTDAHALSATEAWAVGSIPGVSAPILKWDGTIWTSVPSGTPAGTVLTDLHMLSSTDGWTVGCSAIGCGLGTAVILRWNGLAWSSVTPPAGIAGLLDVYMLSPTDGWAVGTAFTADTQGTLIHWDGTQWRRVPAPAAVFLFSVHMVTATDGWAVGVDGVTLLSLVMHWDGLSWDVVSTPPIPPTMSNILTSVYMISALDGWAVSGYTFAPPGYGAGSGLFLHYGPEIACIPTTTTATATTTTSVTLTETSSSTTTIISTTTTAPGGPVPGFPIESILTGLLGGLIALTIIRRRRKF